MQNFGVYYQFDSSYPAPFGSNTNQRQFHAYYMNEDGGGHLKQTYCIQYGIQVSTGSHLTRQDDYSEFSAAQKELLNKVLIMGYSENTGTKYGGTWIEETIATQAMVWIVANNQYGTDWETKIANTPLASSRPKARSIYDAIRSNVEQFNTIPSFTVSTAKAAPHHELKYNAVNGRYEITLTDSNKVLEQFDFSASGISFTRSGNKLTISTAQVLDDLVLTANKTLRNQAYPTLINGSPEYWTHPSWQNLTSINPEGTPAKVPAVMKLFTEKVGHVKLVKESEDGMVGGLPFHITGNGMDQTITTASDGTFLLKNILAGEYAITEVITPNRYVVPETQVITVQPGRTASVKFSNPLKMFHISKPIPKPVLRCRAMPVLTVRSMRFTMPKARL